MKTLTAKKNEISDSLLQEIIPEVPSIHNRPDFLLRYFIFISLIIPYK